MVITAKDGLLGMKTDSRFRRWVKVVDPKDVNLNAAKGYALGGSFVPWGDAVAVKDGQYVVVGAEVGNRRDHWYEYAIGQVRGDELVDLTSEIQERIKEIPVTDAERAKALNSKLYAYAAYIRYNSPSPSASQPKDEDKVEPEPVPLENVSDDELIRVLENRGYVVICTQSEAREKPQTMIREGWLKYYPASAKNVHLGGVTVSNTGYRKNLVDGLNFAARQNAEAKPDWGFEYLALDLLGDSADSRGLQLWKGEVTKDCSVDYWPVHGGIGLTATPSGRLVIGWLGKITNENPWICRNVVAEKTQCIGTILAAS